MSAADKARDRIRSDPFATTYPEPANTYQPKAHGSVGEWEPNLAAAAHTARTRSKAFLIWNQHLYAVTPAGPVHLQ